MSFDDFLYKKFKEFYSEPMWSFMIDNLSVGSHFHDWKHDLTVNKWIEYAEEYKYYE